MDDDGNWVGNVTLDNDQLGVVHLNDRGKEPLPLCNASGAFKYTAMDAKCKRCAAYWNGSRKLLRDLLGDR
jgi:hypothetical protein